MTKYRSVQVSFWQDSFVLDLTPEEKYFYLYLMTNPKATQIGIYELPLKVMELETGYNRETVVKLLNRFVDYKKVVYSNETKEIMLLNWVKHNWNTSPKVITRVNIELKNIKEEKFIKLYHDAVKEVEHNPDKINLLYGIDTVSIDYGYKEKEKEKDKDKEKDKSEIPSDARDYLEKTYSSLTPYMIEDLIFYNDKFEDPNEIIIEAVDIALARSKRSWNYSKAIIQSWKGEGLKTINEVREFESTKKKGVEVKSGSSNILNNIDEL